MRVATERKVPRKEVSLSLKGGTFETPSLLSIHVLIFISAATTMTKHPPVIQDEGNNHPIILPFKILPFCCSSQQLDCCFQQIQVRSVHSNSCCLSMASQLHFSKTKQETKTNPNPNPHPLNPYRGSQGPV